MNPHELLAAWSAWWWPLVAAHLWQSTLFLAATALAVTLLRNASAGTRHRAWLIACLKFALPALLLASPLGWLGINVATPVPYVSPQPLIYDWLSSQPTAVSSQRSVVSGQWPGHTEIYCLLTLAWLAGLVFLGIHWVSHWRRLVRVVSESQEPDNPILPVVFQLARQSAGLKREVRLLVSSAISTPAAYGILKPVILVPEHISGAVNDVELEAVLMHELVHVRRFDNLTAAFQRLLCWFFWFHPLLWLLDRKLLSERELSCDQAVVAHSGAPRAYAAGILKICRFSFRASPAGVSLASGSSLGRRIRMITGPRPQRTRSSHRLVLAALICGLVVLCMVVAPPKASGAAQSGSQLKIGTCDQCPVRLLSANFPAQASAEETSPATIQVRNDGNRPVKYFYVVLENPATEQKAYFRVSGPLQPGETKTVTVQSRRVAVAVKQGEKQVRIDTVLADEARRRLGDLSQVEAKVPTVVFDDNTSFTLKGYLPAPPPPPPPPPAPPAPPAPAAGSRGSGSGSGSGSGLGSGSGSGPTPSAPGAPSTPPAPATPAPPAPPPPPPGSDDDEHFIGGVVGGVPGGVKGGVPGGVVGGVPGGVKGGVPGGVKGGVPGGVKGGVPGGVKGGVPAPAKKRAPKPAPKPAPEPAPKPVPNE